MNIDPWVMSLRTNTTRQLLLKPRQEGCHPLFWFCRSHYCLFSGFLYISRTFLMNELFFKNLQRTLNSKVFNYDIWINVITICNWWGPITELFSLSHQDSFKVHFCVYPFLLNFRACIFFPSFIPVENNVHTLSPSKSLGMANALLQYFELTHSPNKKVTTTSNMPCWR